MTSSPGRPAARLRETARLRDAARLREGMARCFNDSEIADLCQDLGIDVEALEGATKVDRIRSLIQYVQRRQRLPALVARCIELRPLARWTAEPPARQVQAVVYRWLSDVRAFSAIVCRRPLRSYQLEPARAILHSVLHGQGLAFAVMMSRQAGKNELSAQLEAYLMNLYTRRGGQIVKASPTYKPQTVNSILRLCERLDNDWNRAGRRRREGYIVELGKARTLFFSAAPTANVVGGTADLLLECDEAQEVHPEKWDKDFSPMGASTNATTVFWGTAWTSQTMLARRIAHLHALERKDGQRRVFTYDADRVGREVPAYAEYVAAQVARLGRQHPLIKSQYYLEAIDGAGGLFSPIRRALMRGDHRRQAEPSPDRRYALLLDVAGEEEAEGDALQREMLENKRRDASAATVVDVEARYGRLPTYRVVYRQLWLGQRHTSLFQRFLALARHWRAVWVVVDATGVGAGIASFLSRALGDRVLPVVFSPRQKSDLGWSFVGVVETGRYRDYLSQELNDEDPATRQFWHEVEACQYEVQPGPQKNVKWGVWESVAYDGRIAYGHDDLLISAALCAILDGQDWPGTGPSAVIETEDVLASIDRGKW